MANDDRTQTILRRTPESAAMLANVKRVMTITAALNRLTFVAGLGFDIPGRAAASGPFALWAVWGALKKAGLGQLRTFNSGTKIVDNLCPSADGSGCDVNRSGH